MIASLLAHVLLVLREKAVDLRHTLTELFVSTDIVEHVFLMGEDQVPPRRATVEL